MKNTIRNRLLIPLLSTLLFIGLTTSWLTYRDATHNIGLLFDSHLQQSAHILYSLVKHELTEEMYDRDTYSYTTNQEFVELQEHLYEHKYDTLLAFQINIDNQFNFISHAAPREPFSTETQGFSSAVYDDQKWRVYTLHDATHNLVVSVAEKFSIRQQLINEVTHHVLLPTIIGLLVTSIFVYTFVRHGLKPLKVVEKEISERDVSQLEPIRVESVPGEIKTLTAALNKLLDRLKKALDRERQFTSNAAHELRTPLAGLKTQAQVALKTGNEQTRNKALNQLILGVDNATQQVEQLLTLARVDTDTGLEQFTNVNLNDLIADVISEHHTKNSLDKFQVMTNSHKPCLIRGHKDALKIMINNLLDNALAQLPVNGRVKIKIAKTANSTSLSIIDNGPGVPDQDKQMVFNRFHRLANNRAKGSGLGLSIVQRIVDLHNAHIELKDAVPAPGLHVKINFPNF